MLITGTTLQDNYPASIAFDTNATVPTFELFTTLHFRVAGGVAKILCDEGLYKKANINHSLPLPEYDCNLLFLSYCYGPYKFNNWLLLQTTSSSSITSIGKSF